MMQELYRFKQELTDSSLEEMFAIDNIDEHIEPVNIQVDLTDVIKSFDNYIESSKNERWYDTDNKRSQKDAEHSIEIHKALKDVPKRILSDMKFWQYLSVKVFREYTIFRWCSKLKKNAPLANKVDLIKDVELIKSNTAFLTHLLGGSGLKSFTNRHSISRLFVTAEIFYNTENKYELVEYAYSNQNIVTALLERTYCINSSVAQSVLKSIKNKYAANSENIKKSVENDAKKLNLYFTTRDANYLNEKDIASLIK